MTKKNPLPHGGGFFVARGRKYGNAMVIYA